MVIRPVLLWVWDTLGLARAMSARVPVEVSCPQISASICLDWEDAQLQVWVGENLPSLQKFLALPHHSLTPAPTRLPAVPTQGRNKEPKAGADTKHRSDLFWVGPAAHPAATMLTCCLGAPCGP